MTKQLREHRRPNLATIVGSGLAAVAAGSLLAFSSLAEQAGLQGLATGGIDPAAPVRGGGSRAIRLPAPAPAAPGEPVDPIEQIVRDVVAKAAPVTPESSVTPEPAPRVRPAEKDEAVRNRPRKRPDPVLTLAARKTTGAGEADKAGGPPYGNAYGHDKKSKPKPKPRKHPKHHSKKDKGSDAPGEPMHARGRAGESDAGSKPAKVEKVEKVEKAKHQPPGHAKHGKDRDGNGKALGHSKHGKGKGHSKHGKGKGHSKHGKGKGHSKHGG